MIRPTLRMVLEPAPAPVRPAQLIADALAIAARRKIPLRAVLESWGHDWDDLCARLRRS